MPPVLSLALGTGLRWVLQGKSTQQAVAVLTGTSGPEASLWSQAHPLRSPPHARPLPLRTPIAVQPEPTPVGQGASRAPHALGRPALNMRLGHAQRRRPHLTHQDRPPRAHRVGPLEPPRCFRPETQRQWGLQPVQVSTREARPRLAGCRGAKGAPVLLRVPSTAGPSPLLQGLRVLLSRGGREALGAGLLPSGVGEEPVILGQEWALGSLGGACELAPGFWWVFCWGP